MSAQVTMMIPSVEAFDKNVDEGRAREVEFTVTFSVYDSGVHSNRLRAEFRGSIALFDALRANMPSLRPADVSRCAKNKFCPTGHRLYDSRVNSGKDGRQIYEHRTLAAKSFWKCNFIRIGN